MKQKKQLVNEEILRKYIKDEIDRLKEEVKKYDVLIKAKRKKERILYDFERFLSVPIVNEQEELKEYIEKIKKELEEEIPKYNILIKHKEHKEKRVSSLKELLNSKNFKELLNSKNFIKRFVAYDKIKEKVDIMSLKNFIDIYTTKVSQEKLFEEKFNDTIALFNKYK